MVVNIAFYENIFLFSVFFVPGNLPPHPASHISHPAINALHPAINAPHPAINTLHPTNNAPHTAPHILEKLAYNSLAVFVYQFLRKLQTKFFDVSTEYRKCVNKFWGEIYSENCQLFESCYRFQFTLMYHEKSIFCASQPA